MNKFLILITILLSSVNANAEDSGKVKSEDWSWRITPLEPSGEFYAGTYSETDKAVFVLTCVHSKQCVYGLDIHNPAWRCEVDESYPGLISSSAGSHPINLLCKADGRLILHPFTTITDTLQTHGVLSIAVPNLADGFNTVTFSLEGSEAAITGMTAAMQQGETAYQPESGIKPSLAK